MLNENNMLDTFYSQAEMMSEIIVDFQKKQLCKFVGFVLVPSDHELVLESVAEFEGQLFISMKNIVYDMKENIPQLEIFNYTDYIQELILACETKEVFLEQFVDYPEWLTKNK